MSNNFKKFWVIVFSLVITLLGAISFIRFIKAYDTCFDVGYAFGSILLLAPAPICWLMYFEKLFIKEKFDS